jgi:MFS family permease
MIGQSISLIGTWMQRMAISWLVYELTQSAFMLGLVAFAGLIPILILSPYAGAFVDRHSRYKTLMVTQIASMIQAGLLAFVVLTNHYNITIIIILSVFLGIINSFDSPSRQALMIVMVDNKVDLQNAIALNSSMVTMARLVGPAVAGILLSTVGEGICFLLNFLSFIAVLACLFLMKLQLPIRKKNIEPIWMNLKEGYIYLKRSPALRYIILLTALISFVIMPYTTLFPIYAKEIFKGDVTTFGWLNSISGLGALMGALYLASQKTINHLLKIISTAVLLLSANLIFFSYTTIFPMALFFILFAEVGMLLLISASNTYLQTHVEENMRGRVISYFIMAFGGMQPIGNLIIGSLAHFVGVQLTLLIQGVLGIVIILFFLPYFKKANQRDKKKALRIQLD